MLIFLVLQEKINQVKKTEIIVIFALIKLGFFI